MNQFTAICDGESVYQLIGWSTGQRQKIGVTLAKYEELQEMCHQYYAKLVELGEIIPPKSAEEIQQEQAQVIAELADMVRELRKELRSSERKGNSEYVRAERAEQGSSDCGVAAGTGDSDGHQHKAGSARGSKK
jgi:predicted component of type VI protein secretion system